MIGIQAMAVIANETGHTADAANYSSIAQEYITKWQDLAINKDASPPHTTLNYGNSSSHGMLDCNTSDNTKADMNFQDFCTTSMLTPSWELAWSHSLFTRCRATSTLLFSTSMVFPWTHATPRPSVSSTDDLTFGSFVRMLITTSGLGIIRRSYCIDRYPHPVL